MTSLVMGYSLTFQGSHAKAPLPDLIVSTYDIPPGAKLPVHKHPYQRYA
jgi:hypothetical protein